MAERISSETAMFWGKVIIGAAAVLGGGLMVSAGLVPAITKASKIARLVFGGMIVLGGVGGGIFTMNLPAFQGWRENRKYNAIDKTYNRWKYTLI